jgi:hypothetical protein
MTEKWIDFCYIVFYMGSSEQNKSSFSRYNNRISYLKRTVKSSFNYTDRICIFVCNDHDVNVVKENLENVECIKLDVPTTTHLPCQALLYVQNNMKSLGLNDNDIVYFTEADHLLFINEDIKDSMLHTLKTQDVYVSMHRVEPIYKNDKGTYGADRGNNCEFYGHSFVLTNTTRELAIQPPSVYNPKFYRSYDQCEAYSGAHIMKYATFKKVFVPHSAELERASFCCFFSLPCIKTLNYADLYLIHLSTYEYHAMLAGEMENATAPMYNGY